MIPSGPPRACIRPKEAGRKVLLVIKSYFIYHLMLQKWFTIKILLLSLSCPEEHFLEHLIAFKLEWSC